MNIPIEKNKRWVGSIHDSIDLLGEDAKNLVMKQAGKGCVSDILTLCEDSIGHRINSIQDLVDGWNTLRKSRGLVGGWELVDGHVKGIFHECGCPLVRSGLIELHPVQCLCSKGMLETIFSRVAKKEVEVVIRRSIGRGDSVCEFAVEQQIRSTAGRTNKTGF
ncbi:MAG: hypothetical protein MI863_01345 [Desulfobacterales bacterium]|nr:hypothetical protein [Desulfobacterales bacterium]